MLIRLTDGRELRLREFGTKQRAWTKLYRPGGVEADEMVETLGPEAWPAPPLDELAKAVDQPRQLHPLLRDQRAIAGIGRSWVDEVLWEAKLAPFRKGAELDADEVEALHAALHVLGDAIDHYEEVVGEQVPDKLPMPLRVHRREGEPCPRCGTTIEAVYFAEHQTNYCPHCQTGGRVLKDRRLSRLLEVELSPAGVGTPRWWRTPSGRPRRRSRRSSPSLSPWPRRAPARRAPPPARSRGRW